MKASELKYGQPCKLPEQQYQRIPSSQPGYISLIVGNDKSTEFLVRADFEVKLVDPLGDFNPQRETRTAPPSGGSGFDQHSNGWYDGLVDYLKPYQTGDNMALPGDRLYAVSSKVGNHRNMREMVEIINLIHPCNRVHAGVPIAADCDTIRENMLAHCAAISDHSFRRSGEFRLSFSKNRTETSAASLFFSLVSQACHTAQSETMAEASTGN